MSRIGAARIGPLGSRVALGLALVELRLKHRRFEDSAISYLVQPPSLGRKHRVRRWGWGAPPVFSVPNENPLFALGTHSRRVCLSLVSLG